MDSVDDEFPGLSALGLYAAETNGDGNCLFHALSDQLYGNQHQHRQLRGATVDYMRQNSSYYKAYIEVHPGGGTRRNPKRKNAGTYSTPISFTPPTPQEVDRAFESHLSRMAEGGTYGDNSEIAAFANAFNVDIVIYRREFNYMLSPNPDLPTTNEQSNRQVLHIAHHEWEHYSSIRNLDGPRTGLPHVRVKALSPEEEEAQKARLAQTPVVKDWMIDSVQNALTYLVDRAIIRKMLEETRCNIDAAYMKLVDGEDGGFTSSAQESSSIEREHDSEDDAVYGPNKRQDRRMSKSTRAFMRGKAEHRRTLAKLEHNDGSQESISSAGSQGWETDPDPSQSRRRSIKREDEDDSDWRPEIEPLTDDERSSSLPPDPKIRIKMNFSAQEQQQPLPLPGSNKTFVRQQGPRGRVPARQRKELKKQAQKTARKKRAQADAQANGLLLPQAKTELPLHLKNAVEGMKTIHI